MKLSQIVYQGRNVILPAKTKSMIAIVQAISYIQGLLILHNRIKTRAISSFKQDPLLKTNRNFNPSLSNWGQGCSLINVLTWC